MRRSISSSRRRRRISNSSSSSSRRRRRRRRRRSISSISRSSSSLLLDITDFLHQKMSNNPDCGVRWTRVTAVLLKELQPSHKCLACTSLNFAEFITNNTET